MIFHHEDIVVKFHSCRERIKRLLASVGYNFIEVLQILICDDEKKPSDYYYCPFYTYVEKIFILNIREWSTAISRDICHEKIEYLLLIKTNSEWKYINIRENIILKTNEVFEIHNVKILKNTSEKLIFLVGNVRTHQFYHCYERIGRDDAIYFYKYYNQEFHDYPETETRLMFIMNSKCQNYISFITKEMKQPIHEHFSTPYLNAEYIQVINFSDNINCRMHRIRRHVDDTFFEDVVQFIYKTINGKITQTYSKFLLHIYNIFLPVIRLVRIENILIMNEANLINDTIDILCERNKVTGVNDDDILPILLLRAVVFEHTLLCIRKNA